MHKIKNRLDSTRESLYRFIRRELPELDFRYSGHPSYSLFFVATLSVASMFAVLSLLLTLHITPALFWALVALFYYRAFNSQTRLVPTLKRRLLVCWVSAILIGLSMTTIYLISGVESVHESGNDASSYVFNFAFVYYAIGVVVTIVVDDLCRLGAHFVQAFVLQVAVLFSFFFAFTLLASGWNWIASREEMGNAIYLIWAVIVVLGVLFVWRILRTIISRPFRRRIARLRLLIKWLGDETHGLRANGRLDAAYALITAILFWGPIASASVAYCVTGGLVVASSSLLVIYIIFRLAFNPTICNLIAVPECSGQH